MQGRRRMDAQSRSGRIPMAPSLSRVVLFSVVLAVGGAYSTPGNGPFPKGGIIGPLYSWFPFHVYDYSWVVGLVAAFLCYLALSALFPAAAARRRPQAAAAT